MFGNILNKAVGTVSDFVENPVSTTVKVVTQPVRDGLDILDGLSEGEIRTKAIARFGADVVSGMALGELIDLMDLGD